MTHKLKLCLLACMSLLVFSCETTKLAVTSVSYQSIRNEKTNISENPPASAEIFVVCSITTNGELDVYVKNLTDEIMTIDRTKSFYLDPNGVSTIYYDPTVKTKTVTHSSSQGRGGTVNLGAVGGALGIGGRAGQILSGINVGSSSTDGTSVTNATYTIDQPTLSIAPRGQASMARSFHISPIGKAFLNSFEKTSGTDFSKIDYTPSDSYCKFGICISYSIDGGKTYKKIVSNYYANSLMTSFVKLKGRTNDALRTIYTQNKNALNENWFLLYFNAQNAPFGSTTSYYSNVLYDYQ